MCLCTLIHHFAFKVNISGVYLHKFILCLPTVTMVTLTVVLMPSGHAGFGRMLLFNFGGGRGWGLNCELAEFK